MKSIATILGEIAHNIAAMSPIKRSFKPLQESECSQSNVPPGTSIPSGSTSQSADLNVTSEDCNQGLSDAQKSDLTTNSLDETIEDSFPASDPSSQTPISHIGCAAG